MNKFLFSGLVIGFIFLPLAVGAIEFGSPIAATNLNDILNLIIRISLAVVLPLAVIAVLFAAFMILRSQGEIEKVSQGKKILTYGLIGLVVVIVGAGSGALFKNIFKTEIQVEIPGVTYNPPNDYGLPLGTPSLIDALIVSHREEISKLEQELSNAKQKGDTEKIASLTKEITELKEEERSLTLWYQELEKMVKEIADAEMKDWEQYSSAAGLEYLTQYGIKDEQGFYKMQDGSKYNLETKEYIDPTGKVFTNTTLLSDGSVKYCE